MANSWSWNALDAPTKKSYINSKEQTRVGTYFAWYPTDTFEDQVWKVFIYPKIQNVYNKNQKAIVRSSRAPLLLFQCLMTGQTDVWEKARPTVVARSTKPKFASKVISVLSANPIISRLGSGFDFYADPNPADGKLCARGSELGPLDFAMDATSLCGSRIVVLPSPDSESSKRKRATLGGVLQVDGAFYGITAAHVFRGDDPMDTDADNSGSDLSDPEYTTTSARTSTDSLPSPQQALTESTVWRDPASYTRTTDQSGQPEVVNASHQQDLQPQQMLGKLPRIGSRTVGFNLSTDWALVELPDASHHLPNIIEVDGKKITCGNVASGPPPRGQVVVAAGFSGHFTTQAHGSSLGVALPGATEMMSMWTVQGSSLSGDCGSWVVDPTSGDVYGMVVASSRTLNSTYCISMATVFDSIRSHSGLGIPSVFSPQGPQIENIPYPTNSLSNAEASSRDDNKNVNSMDQVPSITHPFEIDDGSVRNYSPVSETIPLIAYDLDEAEMMTAIKLGPSSYKIPTNKVDAELATQLGYVLFRGETSSIVETNGKDFDFEHLFQQSRHLRLKNMRPAESISRIPEPRLSVEQDPLQKVQNLQKRATVEEWPDHSKLTERDVSSNNRWDESRFHSDHQPPYEDDLDFRRSRESERPEIIVRRKEVSRSPDSRPRADREEIIIRRDERPKSPDLLPEGDREEIIIRQDERSRSIDSRPTNPVLQKTSKADYSSTAVVIHSPNPEKDKADKQDTSLGSKPTKTLKFTSSPRSYSPPPPISPYSSSWRQDSGRRSTLDYWPPSSPDSHYGSGRSRPRQRYAEDIYDRGERVQTTRHYTPRRPDDYEYLTGRSNASRDDYYGDGRSSVGNATEDIDVDRIDIQESADDIHCTWDQQFNELVVRSQPPYRGFAREILRLRVTGANSRRPEHEPPRFRSIEAMPTNSNMFPYEEFLINRNAQGRSDKIQPHQPAARQPIRVSGERYRPDEYARYREDGWRRTEDVKSNNDTAYYASPELDKHGRSKETKVQRQQTDEADPLPKQGRETGIEHARRHREIIVEFPPGKNPRIAGAAGGGASIDNSRRFDGAQRTQALPHRSRSGSDSGPELTSVPLTEPKKDKVLVQGTTKISDSAANLAVLDDLGWTYSFQDDDTVVIDKALQESERHQFALRSQIEEANQRRRTFQNDVCAIFWTDELSRDRKIKSILQSFDTNSGLDRYEDQTIEVAERNEPQLPSNEHRNPPHSADISRSGASKIHHEHDGTHPSDPYHQIDRQPKRPMRNGILQLPPPGVEYERYLVPNKSDPPHPPSSRMQGTYAEEARFRQLVNRYWADALVRGLSMKQIDTVIDKMRQGDITSRIQRIEQLLQRTMGLEENELMYESPWTGQVRSEHARSGRGRATRDSSTDHFVPAGYESGRRRSVERERDEWD